MICTPATRGTFRSRSRIISTIRRHLEAQDFIEVETPVLQSESGGADARPFVTYHNSLARNFTLRIATELHLKRLVVGGFERVFEIGRIFRNEGISARHNPEFTSIELYQVRHGKVLCSSSFLFDVERRVCICQTLQRVF